MIQKEIQGPNRGQTSGFNCIFLYPKYLLGSLLCLLSLGYILPDSVIIIVYWMMVLAFDKSRSLEYGQEAGVLVAWYIYSECQGCGTVLKQQYKSTLIRLDTRELCFEQPLQSVAQALQGAANFFCSNHHFVAVGDFDLCFSGILIGSLPFPQC